MKFTNEIPVMKVTHSGSNGISTMKSEPLRQRNQNNRQPLNLQKKNLKGEAADIIHKKMRLALFSSSFILDGS